MNGLIEHLSSALRLSSSKRGTPSAKRQEEPFLPPPQSIQKHSSSSTNIGIPTTTADLKSLDHRDEGMGSPVSPLLVLVDGSSDGGYESARESLSVLTATLLDSPAKRRDSDQLYNKTHSHTARMQRNRELAIAELVHTESCYVDQLRTLIEQTITPIRNLAVHNKKSRPFVDDVNELFKSVEDIFALHSCLLADLQTRCYSWTPNQIISDIFIKVIPIMTMHYKKYILHYEIASELIAKLRTNTKNRTCLEIIKLLKLTERSQVFNGMDMTCFLGRPLQLIPTYILLLERLVQYTPEPSASGLHRCITELKPIAEHIHTELGLIQARRVVQTIALQITHRPFHLHSLVTPTRSFIHQGQVLAQTSAAPCVMYLFSDLIVLAKSKIAAKPTAGYLEDIDLRHCWVKVVDDYIKPCSTKMFPFRIVSPHKSMSFAARTTSDRETWVAHIDQAITALQACKSPPMAWPAPSMTNRRAGNPKFSRLRSFSLFTTGSPPSGTIPMQRSPSDVTFDHSPAYPNYIKSKFALIIKPLSPKSAQSSPHSPLQRGSVNSPLSLHPSCMSNSVLIGAPPLEFMDVGARRSSIQRLGSLKDQDRTFPSFPSTNDPGSAASSPTVPICPQMNLFEDGSQT